MLDEHFGYVSDHRRLEAYARAVAQTVRHGDRVIDLGCGSGVLGLLCLKAGAGWVDAIDSTRMIEVARETLTRAGWADKAAFFQASSRRTVLPVPADLVICDQVGYFGFDAGIVQSLADARKRFLKPGGRVVPSRIQLKVAAVESSSCRRMAHGWVDDRIPEEFAWLEGYSTNTKHAVQLATADLISSPVGIGEIDLGGPSKDFFAWTSTLKVQRSGTLDGICGWFDCELSEGIWMTNSPLDERAIDRPQAFFPIDAGVQVQENDEIGVTFMSRPADQVIAWEVRVLSTGRSYRYSTLNGEIVTADHLARIRSSNVPALSPNGRAMVTVLDYCDGVRTIADIQESVLRDHPDLLPSEPEIRAFVLEVLERATR